MPGDDGKPRPALVLQSDLLAELQSVILCPITSDLKNAAFRVILKPNPANGLRALSQVMADKISTLPRTKLGAAFGRLADERMNAADRVSKQQPCLPVRRVTPPPTPLQRGWSSAPCQRLQSLAMRTCLRSA
ncbi:MAG: type II toxin-antitoxin system PemK/MazF family toxin [Candidatus Accumulibacter sp.]|nr:type II toxin-antitoxin system PemK/MazF family toxin [Candidatus Accumulibacter conexus]